MPEKLSQSLEETKLEQKLECDLPGKYMDIGSVPFNEFSTQCLGELAFPSLFSYGKGDPTSNETIRDLSSKETESFAQKLRHLLKYEKLVNGKIGLSLYQSPKLWVLGI